MEVVCWQRRDEACKNLRERNFAQYFNSFSFFTDVALTHQDQTHWALLWLFITNLRIWVDNWYIKHEIHQPKE